MQVSRNDRGRRTTMEAEETRRCKMGALTRLGLSVPPVGIIQGETAIPKNLLAVQGSRTLRRRRRILSITVRG